MKRQNLFAIAPLLCYKRIRFIFFLGMTTFPFSFINLGCSKNLVDTQLLLGRILTLTENEPSLVPQYFADPDDEQVSLVFLNTCGFIKSGRDEMFAVMKKLLKKGKKVCLLGCAVNYFEMVMKQEERDVEWEFWEEMKEKNQISLLSWHDMTSAKLKEIADGKRSLSFGEFEWMDSPRAYTNAELGFEYLKIAEGCDNHCSFCIIPKIRGKQQSLTMEKILKEVEEMVASGIQEIILIAQDSVRYGTDLYGKASLFDLLEKIDELEGDFEYRVLYLYPDMLSLKHLEKLKSLKKFIPYFDIPFQHISSPILKRMGRFYQEEMIFAYLDFIKANFPEHFIRTNFIIGFPEETEEDHQKLIRFLEKRYFDNIALFEYHDEPLADSSKLDEKVDPKVMRRRFNEAKQLVNKLLWEGEQKERGKEKVGFVTGISEGKIEGEYFISLRPRLHCPEIDGEDEVGLEQILELCDGSEEVEIGRKVLYMG